MRIAAIRGDLDFLGLLHQTASVETDMAHFFHSLFETLLNLIRSLHH